MKTVLIGGPANGRVVNVTDDRLFFTAVEKLPPIENAIRKTPISSSEAAFKLHDYRRERFRVDGREYVLFVSTEMDAFSALRLASEAIAEGKV